MIKLSVIIVNYNVKYFLEQCLLSVRKAEKRLASGPGVLVDADSDTSNAHSEESPLEIFVVDNDSRDGSADMLRQKFPDVKLIENESNRGFSAANNQAIQQASGEYVLLLNPDTVVEEDTFVKVLDFMDTHPDAGALGVKMLDGKGRFLPESKRDFPSVSIAFYKTVGLARLFPRSRLFGRYHLGHLDEDIEHKINVLSGAFMLIRKKVLDEVGLLDEKFFMYGEDIDLSYRIVKAGYHNYYFPGTRIIHYKGESTKRGTLHYFRLFYKAMVIFAEKHLSKGNASLLKFFLQMAIYLRGAMAFPFERCFSAKITIAL